LIEVFKNIWKCVNYVPGIKCKPCVRKHTSHEDLPNICCSVFVSVEFLKIHLVLMHTEVIMRLLSLFLLLSFFSFSALSEIQPISAIVAMDELVDSDPIEFSEEDDRLSILEKMYNEGASTTIEDIKGWWSGRIVKVFSPNTAENALHIVESRIVGGDGGPALPPKTLNRSHIVGNKSKPAEFFDSEENLEKSRSNIEGYITKYFSTKFGELIVHGDSLFAEIDSSNIRYEYRISGDYFVVKATLLKDNGNMKTGDLFAYCYFFKKMK